ncbi:MAG TPA: exodeoxyribonuclease VII large subunit, partial [Acidobacteriota bacterium]
MQQRSLFGKERSSAQKPNSQPAATPASAPVASQNERTSALPNQKIYSVTELNAEFRFLMESTYPSVWVEGEISNFTLATSGHFYFSLKDNTSQLKSVMWKSAHRFMRWRP